MNGLTFEEVMRMNEMPIHDELGSFKQINIPVQHTGIAANYATSEPDYLQPQTQQEHDDLLNTYYDQRLELPNWKELGYDVEQHNPHYDSQDTGLRKDLNVQSSVVNNIQYDPNTNTAMVQVGKKWYNYAATPEQLKSFMTDGSLGKGLNRIRRGYGSMMKTTSTQMPSISTIFGGI